MLQPGDLFFALSGSKTDGNRHLKAALERGAVAVVSELEPPPPPALLRGLWIQAEDALEAMGQMAAAFFGRPSRQLAVVGVTGTNGKTTTTYFLEAIIGACGGTPGVAGTVDYRAGGRTLAAAANTTPISLELQRLLARFRDAGVTHAALEVSSHALAQKRVSEVEFDAAVLTNLSRDHLDFHKTPQAYLAAKLHLFELLTKPSSSKTRRIAAVNADDPSAPAARRAAAGADLVLFGLGPHAGLRAENLESTRPGSRFELDWRGRRLRVEIGLIGRHNVYNALAAAAAALGLGLPPEGVAAGLRALRGVPGRLEPIEEGQDFLVLVDYAHTASALEAALACLAGLPHRRLLTVFGCGGERDRGKRGPMGAIACRGSDRVFVTSDNPRGEDPLRILAEIEAGIKTAGFKNYKLIAEREAAIGAAIAEAGAGDIVLIAGKGHEATQIIGDRVLPFDDRAAARAALRSRSSQ